jgi:hypothetical protein
MRASHVVASNDVQPQRHLLHSGTLTVDALVTFVENQINCLIETAQVALTESECNDSTVPQHVRIVLGHRSAISAFCV